MARAYPKRLSIIAACASNGVIGDKNSLPWRIPEDMARFRQATMGHCVIMGRKTFESIPAPLKGRRCVVISSNQGLALAQGCVLVNSMQAAIDACDGDDEPFVIGGARAYACALPFATRMLITRILVPFDGDCVFPSFNETKWRGAACERVDSACGIPLEFVEFERLAP